MARDRIADQRDADKGEDPQRRLARTALQALAPAGEAFVATAAEHRMQRKQKQRRRDEDRVVGEQQRQPLQGREVGAEHQGDRGEVGQCGDQFDGGDGHAEYHVARQSSARRGVWFRCLVRGLRREDAVGQQPDAEHALRDQRRWMIEAVAERITQCAEAQHHRDAQAQVSDEDAADIGQQARSCVRPRQQPQGDDEGGGIEAVEQREAE